LHGLPLASPRRGSNPARLKRPGNPCQRLHSTTLDLPDNGKSRRIRLSGIGRSGRPRLRHRLGRNGAAELPTACPGSLQGRLGALADPARLILSHGRENMERQPGSKGLVASQEFDTRIHEIRNEGDVAGQPIQLSNQERPLALPSRLQRLRQLWTVRSLPGLDLDKGCQDGPAMLACESLYGSSLSFQAKAALALSNGANP
jgi:hypothetical protein